MEAINKSMEAFGGNMLFIEELSADDCEPKILQNFSVDKTVGDIKKAIAVQLGQPDSWESLQTLFAGTILEDTDSTLASYNVVNGDTIYYVRSTTQVLPPPYPGAPDSHKIPAMLSNLFFRDLDGKTQTLHQVPLDSNVKDVVARYGNEKAVDVEWLRFLWGRKQLWPSAQQNDTRSLRDYGLGQDSTVHVTARLRGGDV